MAGDADLDMARSAIETFTKNSMLAPYGKLIDRLVRRVEEGDSAIAAYAKELGVEAHQVKLMMAITAIVKERDSRKARTRPLVEALERIIKHYEVIAGPAMTPISGVVSIARKALEDFRAG